MCFARQPAVVALAGKAHADCVRLQAVAGTMQAGATSHGICIDIEAGENT